MQPSRRLLDLFDDPAMLLDAQGRILAANESGVRALGEAGPGGFAGMLPAGGQAEGFGGVARCVAAAGVWRGRVGHGARLFDATVRTWPPGEPGDGAYLAVLRDVTAEEAMRASYEELRNLFDAIMDSIKVVVLVRNEQGDLVYCSPFLSKASTYSCGHLTDMEATVRLIHPEDRGRFVAFWERVFGGEEQEIECRALMPDESVRWFRNVGYWDAERRLSVGLIYDVHDRKVAEDALREARDQLEVRVRERMAELERTKRELEADIEARKRAEAERDRLERELRRSQTLEAMGRLAGGVAHDFNNLLGGILGCLYAARLCARSDPDAVIEELDRARQICKHGGELTRQLLTVARRRVGGVEPIPLSALLREVRGLLERTVPKNIRVVLECDPVLPTIRADRSLLTTAVLNLGFNGCDAMRDGGTLTLSGRWDRAGPGPGTAVIRVSDTGVGMPPEIQDRIFEPFFTTKAPEEGTGLGLAMVYATVKECRGEIEVESAPGQGATFTLRIPASGAAPSPEASPAAPAAGHPATEGVVLVVEDEDDVARMMTHALGRHGYRALRAATGLEALELLKDHRESIGLVVLDLLLPEFGGENVYRFLRSLVPDLAVLLATGREDLARNLDPEAPVLPKPFGEEEFLEAVAAAVAPPAAPGPP